MPVVARAMLFDMPMRSAYGASSTHVEPRLPAAPSGHPDRPVVGWPGGGVPIEVYLRWGPGVGWFRPNGKRASVTVGIAHHAGFQDGKGSGVGAYGSSEICSTEE